jgi:RND family efflux transporter MFP subunit
MRKYLTKRNIIIAAIAILIVGWWWRGKQAAVQKAASAEKIVAVFRTDVVSSITVAGEIAADKQAILNFPAPGKLSYIGVKVGDQAKNGHILAALDPGDLQTAWNRAYYTYIAADANAKQVEDAVKGHDSDESFAQKTARTAAQTARDEAYDAMLAARRAINNSRLVAPFDGIVTNVTATAVGDTVSVTDGVTVVDPTSLYFTAEVDESDVGKITLNEPVSVTLDAFPGENFSATISEIGFVSQLSSTGATIFPVKIKLDKSATPKLRIGMNGDADIILVVRKNVLSLPVEAVVDGKVTLSDKEAKQTDIKTGLEGDTLVEIISGLNEGEKVVIKQ